MDRIYLLTFDEHSRYSAARHIIKAFTNGQKLLKTLERCNDAVDKLRSFFSDNTDWVDPFTIEIEDILTFPPDVRDAIVTIWKEEPDDENYLTRLTSIFEHNRSKYDLLVVKVEE